jgi:hypothetical protein
MLLLLLYEVIVNAYEIHRAINQSKMESTERAPPLKLASCQERPRQVHYYL